jgi:hydroxymethylglutaryl-CoA lyase
MKEIIIHEVGLRDGLQMEEKTVPTEIKIKWAEILIESGIDIIQLGSFVNPQKVPQMADTDELFEYFNEQGRKPANVLLSGLVLNKKGYERGIKCGVDMFCFGVSASETHSIRNTGMTVAEATEQITGIAKEALSAGKLVQASVQSAFGCGYEGEVPEGNVLSIVKKYLEAGIRIISLADTVGYGKPEQVRSLYSAIRALDGTVELACHFHNTHGNGLVNCLTAYSAGVKYFESAFAGLGGCPFTKSPIGNIATEALVSSFQAKNIRNDIKMENLKGIAKIVNYFFGRELPGFAFKF